MPDVLSRSAPVLATEDPQALDHIHTSGTSLVLWRRTLPSFILTWLEALPVAALPTGRVRVTPDLTGSALQAMADRAETPQAAECGWLLADIEILVAAFARVSRSPQVDLRLEAISHDACWRFHRDFVPYRLVTTYRGPGTQWVGPDDSDAALRDQKAYAGALQTLPAGHVALFKGALSADGGVVHRSPPMTASGKTRLFLCLNKPSEASPDLYRSGADIQPGLERDNAPKGRRGP